MVRGTSRDRRPGPWLIFTATSIGVFMSALDAGIVAVALPAMSQSFNVDISLVQWTLSAYLLCISVLLPLAGRLGDIRSQRQVFIAGLFIFTLASGLCGLSGTFWHLVAARVLQAIGAAMTMAIGPAIIMRAFPGKTRGRALGLNATIVALGLMAGPGIGGLLLEHASWSFIFLVNVPVGVIGLALCLLFLPRDRAAGKEPLDILGALSFAFGMTALLAGVSHGNDWGWGTWPVLLCIGSALAGFGAFCFVERRSSSPLIDFSVAWHPLFLLPSLAAFFAYMASYAVIILMPFYLSNQLKLSPQFMGLLMTIGPAVIIMISPLSGWLSEKVQPSMLAAVGLLITAIGLILQSLLSAESSILRIAAGQLTIGLGFGVFSSPNNNSILGSAPAEKSGLAGGLLALTRNLGMVFGLSLATSIFEGMNGPCGHGAGAMPEANGLFFPGFRTALLAAAGLTLVAALFSIIRGRMRSEETVPVATPFEII